MNSLAWCNILADTHLSLHIHCVHRDQCNQIEAEWCNTQVPFEEVGNHILPTQGTCHQIIDRIIKFELITPKCVTIFHCGFE